MAWAAAPHSVFGALQPVSARKVQVRFDQEVLGRLNVLFQPHRSAPGVAVYCHFLHRQNVLNESAGAGAGALDLEVLHEIVLNIVPKHLQGRETGNQVRFVLFL